MNLLETLMLVASLSTLGMVLYDNRSNLHFFWEVWARIKFKVIAESAILLFVVISGVIVLCYAFPFLGWGWMNLVNKNGGNYIIAPLLNTGSPLFSTALMLLLLFAVPFLVQIEEKIFRQGYLKLSSIIKRSLIFGFLHISMGIPLSAAIMLCFVGFFFASKYVAAYWKYIEIKDEKEAEKEALMESIVYHTAYNSLCFSILIAVIWLT
jgi:hypothetical protein